MSDAVGEVSRLTLIRHLAAAAHLGPSLVVVVVAAGLAISADASLGQTLLVVGAVGTGQLSIGWSNDWLDDRAGRDSGRPDKPLADGSLATGAVGTAAGVALAACVLLSLALGPLAAGIHLLAVAGGWAYNLGLKATAASVLPYLLSFGLLPSVVTASVVGTLAPLWAAATGAAFGAGVHFANVLPDLDRDRAAGVRGLPQRVGAVGSTVATIGCLAAGTAVILAGAPSFAPALRVGAGLVCVVLLAALGVAAVRGARELAYRLAMLTGLVLVALLVAADVRVA
ncbi:UbiA family prenyltransferase [Euzebya tangerina]|uniref:UbiA family prenyltransferase n=1 Tax=Euzebya tangerina TaxID=591198 RepID=UPI000E32133C|nr:UbiA family prenyltransferase [Euzebya tangerina]